MASSSRLQRVHFYMMLLLLSGLVFALGISRISSLRFHRFKVDLDGKKSVWYQEEKEDSIFLQLNPGTSSETAERPHQAPVFTVEKEMRTSHDFLGYLERELALSKRGPWRNGSRGHLTVRTVELNNGGNVRDWFKTHGAYVQAWMLQDASADQQYDRMYRDWGKEIFEKRRFSKNALKEIRANGRQWCFPSSLSRRSAVSCLLCSSKACLLPTQLKRTRSHDSWYKIYLQSLYRETVFWLS
mmetsp:Transcript_10491/g.24524  ORF Transcript_10491/g.24524 Transcript_10491/m.24524 type:complete len:242 (-) Transcript_10491:2833-3558(-)